MGLNRMMMKSNKVLKGITAEMVPALSDDWKWIGFIDGSSGELSPNPLPNGVRVSSVAFQLLSSTMQLLPTSIKSCTFKDIDITVTHGEVLSNPVAEYLVGSFFDRRAIPIIFHF
mgnify:FL=1